MGQFDKFISSLANYGDDVVKKQRKAVLRSYGPELSRTLVRVSEIKNLLYRQRPAKIKDIFVEPTIVIEGEELSAADLFHEFINTKRVVLRGSAGLGKSVLLKQFCLRHVDQQLSIAPLFLELRKVEKDTSTSISRSLHKVYGVGDAAVTLHDFEQLLQVRAFSVILDGFDETHPEIRSDVEGAILSFASQYPACPIIVSGRSERTFLSWEQFTVYDIAPMTEKLTVQLIEKLKVDAELKNKFITEAIPKLFSNENKSFVQTPLLAVLMLLTYGSFADVPSKMHIFYGNAFETLLRDHDVTKSQFRRSLVSGLSEEDFKRLFAAFCALTYSKGQFEFSLDEMETSLAKSLNSTSIETAIRPLIEDLTLSICVMQYENLEYSFVHRSFQEYFTAVFLRNSPLDTVSAFLSQRHQNRENVIPMLLSMDRERIESEWVMPKLLEFASFSAGDNMSERIESVLHRYFRVVGFSTTKGTLTGMRSPDCESYSVFMALESMYPSDGPYRMWWLSDFDERKERLETLVAKNSSIRLSATKDNTSDLGRIDYRLDLENIDFDEAADLNIVADAEFFILNFDRVYKDVFQRVQSRDSFASALFSQGEA